MGKYSRGDVLIEKNLYGDPISYAVVLREIAPDEYLLDRINVDHTYDFMREGAIDNWYELCDHKVTGFKEKLTPDWLDDRFLNETE